MNKIQIGAHWLGFLVVSPRCLILAASFCCMLSCNGAPPSDDKQEDGDDLDSGVNSPPKNAKKASSDEQEHQATNSGSGGETTGGREGDSAGGTQTTMGGAGNGGAAPMGGLPEGALVVECLLDQDCPSSGVCQKPHCTKDSRCEVQLIEDLPCENACTKEGLCEQGVCVGHVKELSGKLLDTEFSFGSTRTAKAKMTGGIAVFLDNDHVIYADHLAVGTLLSLVEIKDGQLRVQDSYLTSVYLDSFSVGPQVWANTPVTHLVSWSSNRFALVDGIHGLQTFSVEANSIRRMDRLWPTETLAFGDAVATSEGRIWVSTNGVRAYDVDAAGIVSETELAVAAGGFRLVVGSDSDTVYGVGLFDAGVARFQSSVGADSLETQILQGSALDLSVQEPLIMLQRAARHGAFGDIELYDLSSSAEPLRWSQAGETFPYSGTLLAGGALLGWQRQESPSSFQMTLEWTPLSSPEDTQVFVERERKGTNDWTSNIGRSTILENRALVQPWRRLVEVSGEPAQLRSLTGVGNGTFDQAVALGNRQIAIVSPDSNHVLEVTKNELNLAAGQLLDSGATHRVRALLPPENSNSSIQSYPALREISAQEPVELLRATEVELHSLGELDVKPGWLLQRGADFLEFSSHEDTSLRLRALRISNKGTEATLLELGEAELQLHPEGEGERVVADFDPVSRQVAFAYCTLEIVTLHWGGFTVNGLWEGEIVSVEACPEALWVNELRMILFNREGAEFWDWQEGKPVRSTQFSGEEVPAVSAILGFRQNQLYVSERLTAHPSFITLNARDLSVVSRQPIVDDVTSIGLVKDHLFAATKASVHLFEPACQDGSVLKSTWPLVDADEERPSRPDLCLELNPCVPWSAPEQPGDVNGDGCVDESDFEITSSCMGIVVEECRQSILADLDGDGDVDVQDYLAVTNHLGEGCE